MNKRAHQKTADTISVEQVSRVVRNLKDYIAAARANGYILPRNGANLVNR